MDMKTVQRKIEDGREPSHEELQEAISQINTDSSLTSQSVIANTGRNFPEKILDLREEFQNIDIEELTDEDALHFILVAIYHAVKEDPTFFDCVSHLISDAIVTSEVRSLPFVFNAIREAAETGQQISDEIVEIGALRIQFTPEGPHVRSCAEMYEELVKSTGADSEEALRLIVGLVRIDREDLSREFGNVLADIVLQKSIPQESDSKKINDVLRENEQHITIPGVDLKAAISLTQP